MTSRALVLTAVLAAACGGSTPAPRTDDPKRIETLANRVETALLPRVQVAGEDAHATLADRMAALRIPGVSIAVFEDHRLVWAQAYGVTEAGGTTPVTTSTLFQAGSVSKSVNALAVLMAAADGTLSLDGPVNAHLKSWQLPDNELTRRTPVTIRQLLSHTAGTTVHGFPGYADGAPVPTLRQVLDGLPPANTPAIRVDLAPGTQFRYSGGGTSITQLALVDQLGVPYPALMRERVLAPLGMTASTYEQPLPAARVADAATGHHADGSIVPGKRHVYPEMAAAGLWTTPSDLVAFFAALTRARAGESSRIPRDIAIEMTTAVAPAGPGSVGLGVFLSDRNGTTTFGHGGADDGFQADAVASLDGGYGVVVMAASDNGFQLFPEIERTVWAAMGWPGADVPIERVPLDAALRDRYVGTYVMPRGLPVSIAVDGDRLVLALPLDATNELVPVAGGKVVDRIQALVLALDADGGLVLEAGGGEPLRATRLDASTKLPLVELAAGRFDDAVAVWKAGLAADPASPWFAEAVANEHGYALLGGGRIDGAVAVFRLIVAVFPTSSNAYDSLADGLTAAGDIDGAIAAREQSIATLDADPTFPAELKAERRAYEEAQLEALRRR